MAPPRYRFLPWARSGLAQGIVTADPGGIKPVAARAATSVTLRISGTSPLRTDIQLYGPGDVTGIDRRVIIRTDPAPNASDFEPNHFALIEFDPPDFPWLFTPARAGSKGLRPWCVLIVVEQRDGVRIQIRRDSPLPVLTIDEPAEPVEDLPDLAESSLWAHSQILEDEGSSATGNILTADPDRTLSRLICPRRLKPNTHYHACLVPAFDAGRERGLGRDPGERLGPAWVLEASPPAPVALPLYHFWDFATAGVGDIESMARRLHGPQNARRDLGQRSVYTAAAHPAVATPPLPAGARRVTMRGALVPTAVDQPPPPTQGAALTNRLRSVIAKRDTPALPPPLYGEWPADAHVLPSGRTWFDELNTIVVNRVAAALGAEVVRRNQEPFVQSAWEQVGQVRAANELASRARLSATVLERLIARHLAPLPAGRLLQVLGPALRSTASATPTPTSPALTVAAAVDDASVPTGATSATFRRMASGQRQATKRAAVVGGLRHGSGLLALTTGTSGAARVEPSPAPPDGVADLRDKSKLLATGSEPASPVSLAPLGLPGTTTLRDVRRLVAPTGAPPTVPAALPGFFPPSQLPAVIQSVSGRFLAGPVAGKPALLTATVGDAQAKAAATAVTTAFRGITSVFALAPSPPVYRTLNLTPLRTRMLKRLSATSSVARRVGSMIDSPTPVDPYRGVMAFPILPEPTYQYLDQLPGSWMLLEAGGLEPDTAILLQTNTPFTVAFLAGMNHEMSSELLWRSYPTDQRGTPFQRFWDRIDDAPDIVPIHQWNAAKSLAAAGDPTPAADGTSAEQVVLLLRGQLLRRYPDMVVYATTGTRERPNATIQSQGRPQFFGRLQPDLSFVGFPMTQAELASADWWFILEQQLAAPRFGFDVDTDDPNVALPLPDGVKAPEAGRHFSLAPYKTADVVAVKTKQQPIQVAFHRDSLLLPQPPGTP